MPLRFNATTLSFSTPRRIICRSLLLLLTFSLLAGTLAAQTDQEAKRVAAEKLFKEGVQLFQEGTKESLAAAIEKLAGALPLFHSLDDHSREALTLANLGFIYTSLGEQQKALDYFVQALPLFHAGGDRLSEATTLANIGRAYRALGEKQKALDYFVQALPLSRAVGDRRGEATTLNNIGRAYDALGEKQKALEYFGLALLLFRSIGDRSSEGDTLNNIGRAYRTLGEKQKALDYFVQALLLKRALSDRRGEGTSLINIGVAYSELGERQKALDYFAQALPLSRAVGDRSNEASTLHNIGVVYIALGENQKALGYLEQALQISRAVGDRDEGATLGQIGRVYHALGEEHKALDYFEQALTVSRAVGDSADEAATLNNMGLAYDALGDKQKALDKYGLALRVFRATGDRTSEAAALSNIALVERNRGNLDEARMRIDESLAIIETLRTKISNQELRSSYFASVQVYYEFYIDLLMRLHKQCPTNGHDGEALQVSERARARALLETLAEANADIRQGVDPTLVARERTLQLRLNTKAQGQMNLLSHAHTEEQAKALTQEIEALTAEFQQVETQIRQTSPRYAALTQPQPLTLKEIQTQVLDADTLLLEYSLGKDHSYLWAVTPDSIKSYELPKREEVEASAHHLYDLLNARNERIKGETQEQRAARVAQADKEIPTAAASLSQTVLAPVVAQLGKKRLVIVADGVLQYIPFAVLPAPTSNSATATPQPLIVEHEVVSLPSASTLAVLRREVAGRKPAPKTVVALADPVFMKNDERVKNALNKSNGDGKAASSTTAATETTPASMPAGTETVRELELVEAAEDTGVSSGGLYVPRLPGSRKEAAEIVAMVPATESRLALDFEASRDMATSAELSQYRYVHFSTHGFLNSVHPELSGIVFSLVNKRGEAEDGFLRAHEVFNLKLPAEVVVLSACQTGIGKEVKGEGLVSLTRGFMYAGAPRVVVSLWSVNETGTAELMVRFYREMLKEGKPAAAALRAAQISLMKEKQWQSPFYWAAFTLQGEWR
jgi:CHAT domain-containing protein/tetratricopeptide (TPR) repeat protein